jgi:hypothetical protein
MQKIFWFSYKSRSNKQENVGRKVKNRKSQFDTELRSFNSVNLLQAIEFNLHITREWDIPSEKSINLIPHAISLIRMKINPKLILSTFGCFKIK